MGMDWRSHRASNHAYFNTCLKTMFTKRRAAENFSGSFIISRNQKLNTLNYHCTCTATSVTYPCCAIFRVIRFQYIK